MVEVEERYSSAWRKLSIGTVTSTIQNAYNALRTYARAHDVQVRAFSDETYVALTAILDVNLPSRGPVGGVDVRQQEPLTFLFHRQRYPFEAPRVLADRISFPKTFPHLNPTPRNSPASLCLHRGSIDEWFAEHTFTEFLDRVRGWLMDAAAGELIKEVDRFEPTRVDEHGGLIVFPYATVLDAVTSDNAPDYHYAPLEFVQNAPPREGNAPYRSFFVYRNQLKPSQLEKKSSTIRGENDKSKRENAPFLKSVGVLMWPEKDKITAEYFGELPTTFDELVGLANAVGCPLHTATRGLVGWMRKGKLKAAWIPVIFAIRRPLVLVGQSTTIELLTFLIESHDNGSELEPIAGHAPVHALLHLEPLTRRHASELSRHHSTQRSLPQIALLGSGALGSKIALHLGRGGHDALTIIDNDVLLPHNFVRHALLSNSLFHNKALALDATLRELFLTEHDELQFSASDQNALDAITQVSNNVIAGHELVLDATASNVVFNALSTANLPEQSRVVRCEIADEGRLSIWLSEGEGRSPRIDDLRTLLFASSSEDIQVANWLKAFRSQRSEVDGSLLEEIQLGVSCGSSTLRLSDDVVSYHAATMTMALRNQRGGEFGLVWYSLDSEQPFGSTRSSVGPTLVLHAPEFPSWEVRLLAPATTFMRELFERDLPNETGGILLGHIDLQRHIIYVAKAMGPPPDSEQRPYLFKKGSKGVSEAVTKMRRASGELVTYVGDWHTHLTGGTELSPTDWGAISELRPELDKLSLPTHILIVTPDSFAPHLFLPDNLIE